MLILALQYWSGDYDHAMRLARFIAGLEEEKRKDVEFLFVPRFDAPDPEPSVLIEVGARFAVSTHRSRRRGVGHPAGCNDLWHDLLGEMWRRCLQVPGWADKYHGVYSLEADNVPLCRDWLDRIQAEWKAAREAGKLLLGCRMETPAPHINGNLLFVPNLYGRIRGLEGCPSQYAWDVFHADKWLGQSAFSAEITNFYQATEVPRSRIYGKGGAKYAVVHGVKDDSVFDAAKKFTQKS